MEDFKYIPIAEKIKSMVHYINRTFNKPDSCDMAVRFSKEKGNKDLERVVDALFNEVIKAWANAMQCGTPDTFSKYEKACKVFDDYCEVRELDIDLLCVINNTFNLMYPYYGNKNTSKVIVNC